MIRELLYILVGVVFLSHVAERILGLWDDPREPPRVWSRVPFVGHAIGLTRYGPEYFRVAGYGSFMNPKSPVVSQRFRARKRMLTEEIQRRKATKAEIYTLALPGSKTYVSNRLHLMTLIQRNSKSLSFAPFAVMTSKKMAGASDDVLQQLTTEFANVPHRSMRNTLQNPSSESNQMSSRMAQEAARHVDKLVFQAASGTTEQVMLLEWVRHVVVQASSCGVYGLEHPFRDPDVERAFW